MGWPMQTAIVASGRLVGRVRKLRNSSARFRSKMGMGVMPTTFPQQLSPPSRKTHFLHPGLNPGQLHQYSLSSKSGSMVFWGFKRTPRKVS